MASCALRHYLGAADYVANVAQKLKIQGFRVATDLRNEKITLKMREHSMQKPPYILVMGDKEKAAGIVAVCARGNVDLGVMPVDDFIAKIVTDITAKA
jgi:threonyl-tRNA synthetase